MMTKEQRESDDHLRGTATRANDSSNDKSFARSASWGKGRLVREPSSNPSTGFYNSYSHLRLSANPRNLADREKNELSAEGDKEEINNAKTIGRAANAFYSQSR